MSPLPTLNPSGRTSSLVREALLVVLNPYVSRANSQGKGGVEPERLRQGGVQVVHPAQRLVGEAPRELVPGGHFFCSWAFYLPFPACLWADFLLSYTSGHKGRRQLALPFLYRFFEISLN